MRRRDPEVKVVGIADLEARLGEHLREVRAGSTLAIVDRDRTIALIVPHPADAVLAIRRARRQPGALRMPQAPARRTDSLSALLDDRAST